MRRTLFEEVHEDFRASFRTFLEREVIGEEGRYGEWERAGVIPRGVFALAAACLGQEEPARSDAAMPKREIVTVMIGDDTISPPATVTWYRSAHSRSPS